jgi:hypothetical protein
LRRWVGILLATGGGAHGCPRRRSAWPGCSAAAARRRCGRRALALALPGAAAVVPPAAGGSSLGFGIDLLVSCARRSDRRPVRQPGAPGPRRPMPGDPGLSSDVLAQGSRPTPASTTLGDALAGRGPLADGSTPSSSGGAAPMASSPCPTTSCRPV